MRVKRGQRAHRRHQKTIKKTKGFQKSRSNFRKAKEALFKAGTYAYRDRRRKKRERRQLWIIQINAGLKKYHLSYSRFVNGLTLAKIELDRKMLAKLTTANPEVFEKVVRITQRVLEKA